MKKELFSTKTIVATGLGGALFMVLFMFVKVPSPVPETNLQIAYGVSAFFAAVFGPLCGFLVAFIGHALSDFITYGSPWWSWVVASGVSALIAGFSYYKLNIEEGEFEKKDIITYNIFQVLGNAVAWLIVAPALDVIIYSEPMNVVIAQGVIAFVMDALVAGIVGTLLLIAYSKTKTKKGSLSRE
ncbi:MAG: ECF-type riboflavin transporter substrate-binding protein [Bacillota bacterium]|jgi:energy-coupling factor transport system substrate-specific component|nr:ECF-type riboflavin transporter substrate-binding protein [Bacillota bacterium]NLP22526.1 ECF-type riboflavin transporter substrate-binding protein [Erysipelotrichaceae bacterium]